MNQPQIGKHTCSCTAEDREKNQYCACEAPVVGMWDVCRPCQSGCHKWKKID